MPCIAGEVILGVDTHTDTHTAALLDPLGRTLATTTVPASRRGSRALVEWARLRGSVRIAGVEGTGSYGAGLARSWRSRGAGLAQHPDRLDDPVARLGLSVRPARQHRLGGRFGVARVALAEMATAVARHPGDLDHLDPARSSRAPKRRCSCAT